MAKHDRLASRISPGRASDPGRPKGGPGPSEDLRANWQQSSVASLPPAPWQGAPQKSILQQGAPSQRNRSHMVPSPELVDESPTAFKLSKPRAPGLGPRDRASGPGSGPRGPKPRSPGPAPGPRAQAPGPRSGPRAPPEGYCAFLSPDFQSNQIPRFLSSWRCILADPHRIP